MIAIGISEFTFGYAFLHEQTNANWPNLTAAPILPSLQQEQNLGWDAQLPVAGACYFYQFRLCEYLFRANATYIHDGTYAGHYYRIGLHPRDNNRQHRLLRTLSAQNPNTFYVAPELNTVAHFNAFFLNHTLTQHTRLIPLAECDDIGAHDATQHYITYQQDIPAWNFHSERSRKERSIFGKDLENLYRTAPSTRAIDTDFARALLDGTIETISKLPKEDISEESLLEGRLLDQGSLGENRTQMLQRVADLTAAVFGVTMVIVGPRN
jgi:hypothetical protein